MNIYTDKPKVSIVMSFYNEPLQWIRLAVESVLEQTFKDFEFIIVCDQPTYEEGITYIRDIQDDRIRLMINPENTGPTKSFNKAIASANGDYIARMDADDICMRERLAKQVEYLDTHPDVSVCATDVHSIDKNGRITRRNRYEKKHEQALFMISNIIAHPSVMFRKSLQELRNPIYNEDYIYSQDYELWQFLILKGQRIHTLDQALLLYRQSDSQISTAKRRKQIELFRNAHKSLITGWLMNHDIINKDDCNDLKSMLKKSLNAYSGTKDEDRRYLTYIIYVLYFSLGTIDWRWRLKYLMDKRMIAFRIRFIYTFRMLFLYNSRYDRTGLISNA